MRRALTMLPVLLATLAGAAPASAWTWPADGPVLQPFSFDGDPYAAGLHRGIDVRGEAGASVRAPASGTVTFAGTVPGGGRTVTITTPGGYAVTIVHLGTVGVAARSTIVEGAAVGTIGPSGDVEHAEPYVHLGLRIASDPQGYVDPALVLPPRVAEEPAGDATPAVGATESVEPAPAPVAGTAGPVGGAEPGPATAPPTPVAPVAPATVITPPSAPVDPAPAPVEATAGAPAASGGSVEAPAAAPGASGSDTPAVAGGAAAAGHAAPARAPAVPDATPASGREGDASSDEPPTRLSPGDDHRLTAIAPRLAARSTPAGSPWLPFAALAALAATASAVATAWLRRRPAHATGSAGDLPDASVEVATPPPTTARPRTATRDRQQRGGPHRTLQETLRRRRAQSASEPTPVRTSR